MVSFLSLKIVHEEIIKFSIRQIPIFKKTLLYARPNASLENMYCYKIHSDRPRDDARHFSPKVATETIQIHTCGLAYIWSLSSYPTQIRPQQLVKKPAIISGEESYESSAHLMV